MVMSNTNDTGLIEELESVMKRGIMQGIEEGLFPGGISCVLLKNSQKVVVTGGYLGVEAENEKFPVTANTAYDLASLTKVVVTLPLVLLSVQELRLKLNDAVVQYIPEFASGPDAARKGQVTVIQLLTHTSGLPAWRPYFVRLKGKAAYLRAICSEPLTNDPGKEIIYSDLGFMLLGMLLERIWNTALEQLADLKLFKPLQMTNTAFRPGFASIAPTEKGNVCEYRMALDYAQKLSRDECPEGAFLLSESDLADLNWRGGVIVGEVHDANAFYGMGGVSGHAGLFSTVGDLSLYMQLWRQPSLLSDELCGLAVQTHAVTASLKRGLGWIVYEDDVFGHTGFTGTSLWHDKTSQTTFISLTNRVHPEVKHDISGWRDTQRHVVRNLLNG
jgi:CubicO group peptidase (beta-lactamase class C family)